MAVMNDVMGLGLVRRGKKKEEKKERREKERHRKGIALQTGRIEASLYR
jgi:hypothetical protein